MPVQINEVVIRAVVSDRAEQQGGAASESCTPSAADGSGTVDEIVEKVLEILKIKQER